MGGNQRKKKVVSCGLTAHASPITDTFDEWFDKTNLYDIYDFISGYVDYLKNPDYYPEDDVNIPPPDGTSNADNPVKSAVIPYHYNCYGKERIQYPNGTYEIVVCRLDADLSIDRQPAKGHITFTRNSSNGYSTSFGFDVKLTSVSQSFSSNTGASFVYAVIDRNVTGIDRTSSEWQNLVGYSQRVYFNSLTTNDIYTASMLSNRVLGVADFVSSSTNTNGTNIFTIAQSLTNDYRFNVNINNYQGNTRTKSVNLYYDNHAMDTVTVNNYSNYYDYGYIYNDVTGSLELDPDLIANYFGKMEPTLKLNFDDIFGSFPDIGATIENYTGQLNNLVEIVNEMQSTTAATSVTTATGPVVSGDINVIVTWPEEYYKEYPTYDTTPAFSVPDSDVDFLFEGLTNSKPLYYVTLMLQRVDTFVDDTHLRPFLYISLALGVISFFV